MAVLSSPCEPLGNCVLVCAEPRSGSSGTVAQATKALLFSNTPGRQLPLFNNRSERKKNKVCWSAEARWRPAAIPL